MSLNRALKNQSIKTSVFEYAYFIYFFNAPFVSFLLSFTAVNTLKSCLEWILDTAYVSLKIWIESDLVGLQFEN